MIELHTSLLSPAEISTLAKRLLPVIVREPEFVGQVCTLVAQDTDQVTDLMNRERSNPLTVTIAEKDGFRDDAFVALRDHCKSARRRRKAGFEDAAEKLIAVIERHGNTLHRLGYAEQTAKLTSLLAELATEPLASAVKTIQAEILVEELQAAQNEFLAAQQQSVEAGATSESMPLRAVQQTLSASVTGLLEIVEFQARLNPDSAAIANSIAQIDDLLTETMALARARKTRQTTESEKEATPGV